MIIKLILICLSNSFFNFFIKMKNEKRTVFRFPFFYENENEWSIKNSKKESIKHENGSQYRIIEFWIWFFNLSRKRNGTLGTRIDYIKQKILFI